MTFADFKTYPKRHAGAVVEKKIGYRSVQV